MNAFNDDEIIIKLKELGIHVTQNRVAIYKLITKSSTAVTVAAILKESDIILDRISVYRTLLYFLRKGIVEVVPNNRGMAKYTLATSHKEQDGIENTKKVYFICSCCQHIELMLQHVNIKMDIPDTYKVNKYSLIVEGLCSICK
jgi:Fe2+ or Zn2+ uptake regulation protein